ncbi:MAG: NAD(P)/FAD-dependent oxidoreductase [Gammaproteobacteria bacterium]|nr:NAD(P)/FAD-dependent oxidoreductase [Gammaproteobacteria bacterium]
MSTQKHIVIVGAGAGGLVLATRLGRKYGAKNHLRITLIDKSLTHIWKPLLHEVAAGTLTSFEDEINLFAHGERNGYEFSFGEMIGLDRANKKLQLAEFHDAAGREVLPAREMSYDLLVLAVGSMCNDFGVPGVSEHAIFLDSRANAESFHQRFLHSLLRSHTRHLAGQLQELNIVIVGGGATGVELAAELQEVMTSLPDYGMENIDKQNARIYLVEAAGRLVLALNETVSRRVKRELEKLGIEVKLNTQIKEVQTQSVVTATGQVMEAQLVVWAAGVKAPDWLNTLGLENNRLNQIIVKQNLQSSVDPNIFVFGDCAGLQYEEDGVMVRVPPLAQAAAQQAEYLARVLPEYLATGVINKYYSFHNQGAFISIASEGAVGTVMGRYIKSIGIQGLLARWIYLALYRRHQWVVLGMWTTGIAMIKDLLSRTLGPRLKLH